MTKGSTGAAVGGARCTGRIPRSAALLLAAGRRVLGVRLAHLPKAILWPAYMVPGFRALGA